MPWPLPADGQPGAWMPAVAGDLVLCENGYHACTEANLMIWLDAALRGSRRRKPMTRNPLDRVALALALAAALGLVLAVVR